MSSDSPLPLAPKDSAPRHDVRRIPDDLRRQAHAAVDRLEATRDLPDQAAEDIATVLAHDVAQLLQLIQRLTPEDIRALDRLPRWSPELWPMTEGRWLRPASSKRPPESDEARLLGIAPLQAVARDDGMAAVTVLTPGGKLWTFTVFGRYTGPDGCVLSWADATENEWLEFRPISLLQSQWGGPWPVTPTHVAQVAELPSTWLLRLQDAVTHLVADRESAAAAAHAAATVRQLR